MANFYKNIQAGHFEQVNEKVQSRFLTLNSEIGEESKIIFVLYTSAQQGKINLERLEGKFREQFSDRLNIELNVLFAPDIVREIKEAESRRPTIESGKIIIDRAGNVLKYDNEAVIVNVSALSVKKLYAMHGTNLLAKISDTTSSPAEKLIKLLRTQLTLLLIYSGSRITVSQLYVILSGLTVRRSNYQIFQS